MVLVGTHPDSINCKKNVLGEYCHPPTSDNLMATVLSEFGNVFNIHAHAFLIDAASASPNSSSIKALKTALTDYKAEIIDVSGFPCSTSMLMTLKKSHKAAFASLPPSHFFFLVFIPLLMIVHI